MTIQTIRHYHRLALALQASDRSPSIMGDSTHWLAFYFEAQGR